MPDSTKDRLYSVCVATAMQAHLQVSHFSSLKKITTAPFCSIINIEGYRKSEIGSINLRWLLNLSTVSSISYSSTVNCK